MDPLQQAAGPGWRAWCYSGLSTEQALIMAEVQGEILRAEMFTEAIGRLSAAVASWSKVHVILRDYSLN